MENEPRNKSPEEIKEEAIELGRTIGVQVLFEIDPNKSAGEIEKIYGQTLDFLKGLNPEQVNKLKNEKGDIYISGLDDLNSLVKEFNPHVSGNESVSNEQTVVPQETEDVIEEIESPSPNEKEPNIKKIDGVHVHLSRFVAQNPQITTEQKEDILAEIDGALQDLEQDELKILQDRVTILIKDESVLYPVFDKNTLRVGLFATGEEILNAIRKTVIPLVNEEIKNKTDSMSEVEGSLKVGDKVFWEGSEKVILSIDDQWVEFVDGPIVSMQEFKEKMSTNLQSPDLNPGLNSDSNSEEQKKTKKDEINNSKIEFGFEEISDQELTKIRENIEIRGDAFNGRSLTIDVLEKNDLLPKYKLEVGNSVVWFSSKCYKLDRTRVAIVAYVEKDNVYVPRSYYRSNSQGVWRFLPYYTTSEGGVIDWYGKGYDESSITLPYHIQKSISFISNYGNVTLKGENPEFIFAGCSNLLGYSNDYQNEIESNPVRLNNIDLGVGKISPEEILLDDEQKPNFDNVIDSWKTQNSLYGDIFIEVLPSNDGKFKYIFCTDQSGRIWIGGIENDSEIQSTGLRKSWIKSGDLTIPAFEYYSQAGTYGNSKNVKGPYCDMWENYLSKIPVIKEYKEKRLGYVLDKLKNTDKKNEGSEAGVNNSGPDLREELSDRAKQNQDVVNTPDNNVQNTEPQPTPEGIKLPEFDIEEIKNSDEWKELDDFRKMAVREEIRTKESNTLGLGIKWQDYENKKDLLENKIRESLKPKGTEVLSDEQQKELNKKINTIIFQSLVEEEHKNRLKNEREIKLETVGGKVLEAMKYATGSKAFKWYLNQNKWVRLGAMSSLATIVGIGAGSAVTSGALAYGGYRFARGVASFGASTATAATLQRVKSLSIDELNKKEKEEINNLESSDIPRIEKTEKYNEIKNRYEKLRLQKALIKTGTTVAVGGLAGAGTGALQNFLYDVDPSMVNGGETPASIEASQNDVPKIPEQGPDTQAGAQVETNKPPVAEPKSEGVESPEDNKQEGTEEKKPDEVKKPEDSKASEGYKEDNEKGDLLDTKSFKFIPAKGDSTWKLIEKAFSENPKFDEMTVDMTPDEMRASRSFVVSNYLREALKTPEKFGMGPNGEVYVGKEIDLTELFKDEDKLSQIIEKAKKLSPQQIQSINDNDAKILAWVQNPENQGIRLTNDKVSEILSMKPKSDMAKMFEPNSGEVPRGDVGGEVDPSQPERTSLEVENTEGSTKLEPEKNQEFPYTIEDTERVLEEVRNREPVSAEIDTKEEVGLEKQIEAKTAPNIEDYTDASQPERTGEVYRESIKATSDPAFEKYLDRAFVSGIDDVYGKSRFLGLGRIQGVDTKDWLLMKGLSANKVVEFYSGNSQEVDFPQNVAKELATSDSHAKFWKQMDVLMKASGGVVRPYQNENVAVFMRRLVGHTLKNVKTT